MSPNPGPPFGTTDRVCQPQVLADLQHYGIPSDRAIGVPTGAIHLADPGLMTAALMQDGCAGFDNGALSDTATFHLFDKTAARWGGSATLVYGHPAVYPAQRAGDDLGAVGA